MVSAAPPSPAPAQPRFSCVPRPSLGDQHHEGDAPVLVQAVLGGREERRKQKERKERRKSAVRSAAAAPKIPCGAFVASPQLALKTSFLASCWVAGQPEGAQQEGMDLNKHKKISKLCS